MNRSLSVVQRAALWLAKAAVGPIDVSGLYTGGGWNPIIREPFAGAWQRNISLDLRGVTAFSAVYACIRRIADDIAKIRPRLMAVGENGILTEVVGSPLGAVLKKPNRYQSRVQFWSYWEVSKLIYGNAYAYKERDQRGVVRALYVLDPRRVMVKAASDGSVWYEIHADPLNLSEQLIVPASEIIHDRCITLFHPLIGVSPIYAAGMSAAQGVNIQQNSAQFFANMSAPSGHLSAPGKINDETSARLQRDFETAKGGVNLGRLLVTGDGMKYEPFSMPAVDAQLIEQLRWTVEDVARCFGVPLHKIQAGPVPQVGSAAALDQDYYEEALQPNITAAEVLLDDGLGLDAAGYVCKFDVDTDLLRMDPLTRADVTDKRVKAGTLKPNEARASENLQPVEGGDECYLQQQNFSLAALAKRDAKEDPFATGSAKAPELPAPPEPPESSVTAASLRVAIAKLAA